MDPSVVITYMIGICAVLAAIILFSKPIKSVLRFIIQAACGVLGSFIVNFILSPIGVTIGINYLNAFVVGVLGLPGFISLYFLSWLL